MIIVLSTLAAAGCASGREPPRFAFASDRPLVLNVAAMDGVSAFQASDQPPRVEKRFPAMPETALRRWTADRLRAGGRAGTARFTITDAAVIRTDLPMTCVGL